MALHIYGPDEKWCCGCDTVKPRTEFYKARNRPDGLKSTCKTCSRIARQAWAEENPDKVRGYERLRHYDLSPEDYEQMLAFQEGKCAICGATESGHRSPYLLVDHCHVTGNVRGLLCHLCNVGLGGFRDDPALLLKATRYLGYNR